MNVSQALTWAFTFLVGILLSSVNLVIFSLSGGTSSILRTFLGGTSEKTHPVHFTWKARAAGMKRYGADTRTQFLQRQDYWEELLFGAFVIKSHSK